MDYQKLAELLYPNCKHDIKYYLDKYPERNLPQGAEVTRTAPSPTGFYHTGSLFGAMIDKFVADKSGGIFFLRIEDTDQKRFIPGAADIAYNALCNFNLKPDEGFMGENKTQLGNYGSYIQSERLEIYHTFAKELVKCGKAFPCFCDASESKEDILERRLQDLSENETITEHDVCRTLSIEEIENNIKNGKPWALRLLSTGNPEKQFEFVDQIKGKRLVRENAKDIVLVKSNGIPPYALAHVVDDTLMRVSTVIRGEEWWPSLNAHLEIFHALGLKPPKYAHHPLVCKLDEKTGNKRKLSKRLDPEADSRYFTTKGYPSVALNEYLLNLINSDFENWRKLNPDKPYTEFPFSIKKILSSSNPMFDLVKINDISKNVISRWPAEKIFAELLAWATEYDQKYANLLQNNKETMLKLLNIDRGGDRPRKDIYAWNMVEELYRYVFEDFKLPEIEERIDKKYAQDFLIEYIQKYDINFDKQAWFEQIKQIALVHNFADNKEYKAAPEKFAGNIADACNLVRIAITGRSNSPDLCSIMKLLGKDKVEQRLNKLISFL